jgi:hypothetical protein
LVTEEEFRESLKMAGINGFQPDLITRLPGCSD